MHTPPHQSASAPQGSLPQPSLHSIIAEDSATYLQNQSTGPITSQVTLQPHFYPIDCKPPMFFFVVHLAFSVFDHSCGLHQYPLKGSLSDSEQGAGGEGGGDRRGEASFEDASDQVLCCNVVIEP